MWLKLYLTRPIDITFDQQTSKRHHDFNDVTGFKCRYRDFLSNQLPTKQNYFFLISSLGTLKDTFTPKIWELGPDHTR